MWLILFCVICRTRFSRFCLQRHFLPTLSLIINKKKKEGRNKKRFETFLQAFTRNFRWILPGALYLKTKNRKSWKFFKHPKILKYENVISKTLGILFKWHYSQNDSATVMIMCHIFVFQEMLTPLDLLNWVCFFCLFVYFGFNTQKVEIMIEN